MSDPARITVTAGGAVAGGVEDCWAEAATTLAASRIAVNKCFISTPRWAEHHTPVKPVVSRWSNGQSYIFAAITASTSISTNMSGETRPLTSTMVEAGRM